MPLAEDKAMSGSAVAQALLKLVLLMMLITVALKTRGLRRSAYPGSAR